MISGGSYDTWGWCIDAENSVLNHRVELYFRYIRRENVILNCKIFYIKFTVFIDHHREKLYSAKYFASEHLKV